MQDNGSLIIIIVNNIDRKNCNVHLVSQLVLQYESILNIPFVVYLHASMDVILCKGYLLHTKYINVQMWYLGSYIFKVAVNLKLNSPQFSLSNDYI